MSTTWTQSRTASYTAALNSSTSITPKQAATESKSDASSPYADYVSNPPKNAGDHPTDQHSITFQNDNNPYSSPERYASQSCAHTNESVAIQSKLRPAPDSGSYATTSAIKQSNPEQKDQHAVQAEEELKHSE